MADKKTQLLSPPLVWLIALLLLAGYAGMCLEIARSTSPTFDEPDHLAVGYYPLTNHGNRAYNDINLTFTQIWSALPLLAFKTPPHFPTAEEQQNSGINYGRLFYFDPRNDTEAMLFWSRAMITLLATALGLVLFLWTRRLWGDGAGLVTLAFYCLNPQTIALGSFATTDIASTLFFTLAAAAVWRLLQRVSLVNILLLGVAAGVLGATKISSLLIIPVAGLMLLVQVAGRRPVAVKAPWRSEATTGSARLLPLLAALAAAVLVAYVTLWAFYGFRYAAMTNQPVPEAVWAGNNTVPAHVAPAMIKFCRDHHLLPEAYLVDVHMFTTTSSIRRAFVLGEYSVDGWWYFFPVAWLFKTPLPFMLALGAGVVLLWRARREQAAALWSLTPLLIFSAVYGVATLSTNLNIGARHLLPLYPLLFVLAGFATRLPLAGWRRPAWVGALLAWSALEAAVVYPHDLAYFNELAGGTAHGYRILVDSSYEWGEGLPDVQHWLEARTAQVRDVPPPPVYFSYFGCADLSHYGIRSINELGEKGNVVMLPSFYDQRPIRPYDLGAGTYVISATMLSSLYGTKAMGPWRTSYEEKFQALSKDMARLKEAMVSDTKRDDFLEKEAPDLIRQRAKEQIAAADALPRAQVIQIATGVYQQEKKMDEVMAKFPGAAARDDFLEQQGRELIRQQAQQQITAADTLPRAQAVQFASSVYLQKIRDYDELRFSRLCAYLRGREPEQRIGYGYLVFELSAGEIATALQGPPAELRTNYFVKGTENLSDKEIDFVR